LPIAAAADLPPGPLVFRIQGRATIDGKVVNRFREVEPFTRASHEGLRAVLTTNGMLPQQCGARF
jgi:hypothetical protein